MNNYEKNYQNKKAKYKAYKAIWKLAHGKFGGDYQKAIREIACLFEQLEKEREPKIPLDEIWGDDNSNEQNEQLGVMQDLDNVFKPAFDFAKKMQNIGNKGE